MPTRNQSSSRTSESKKVDKSSKGERIANSARIPVSIKLPIVWYSIDLVVVAVLWTGTYFTCKFLGPYKSGFFCNDPTLSMPFLNSTISQEILFPYCAFLPLLCIVCVELILLSFLEPQEHYSIYEYGRPRAFRFFIRTAIFMSYLVAFEVIIEAFSRQIKYAVGKLRPTFLTVCEPAYTGSECNLTTDFITEYHCTKAPEKITNERLSFMCFESTLSVGAATYAVLYLQHRMVPFLFPRMIVAACQVLIFSSAIYMSVTRVTDYRHHGDDIIISVFFALTMMLLLCKYVAGFYYFSPGVFQEQCGTKTAEYLDQLDGEKKDVVDGKKEEKKGKKSSSKAKLK